MTKLIATLILAGFASTAHAADAQRTFDSIPGEAMNVQRATLSGEPVVGVAVFEKRQGDTLICQKSGPVVPDPVYTYSCYRRTLTGARAMANYNRLRNELSLDFGLDGVTTREKTAANGFCRKTAPVIPSPRWSYACYVVVK